MRQPSLDLVPGNVFVDDIASGAGCRLPSAKVRPLLRTFSGFFPPRDCEKLSTRRDGSDRLTWSVSAQEFSSSRISSRREWSEVDRLERLSSSYPVLRHSTRALSLMSLGERSRNGRYSWPAWQNRQPRTQPRRTSTQARSCTAPTMGTTKFSGGTKLSMSFTMALVTRSGTPGRLGLMLSTRPSGR